MEDQPVAGLDDRWIRGDLEYSYHLARCRSMRRRHPAQPGGPRAVLDPGPYESGRLTRPAKQDARGRQARFAARLSLRAVAHHDLARCAQHLQHRPADVVLGVREQLRRVRLLAARYVGLREASEGFLAVGLAGTETPLRRGFCLIEC